MMRSCSRMRPQASPLLERFTTRGQHFFPDRATPIRSWLCHLYSSTCEQTFRTNTQNKLRKTLVRRDGTRRAAHLDYVLLIDLLTDQVALRASVLPRLAPCSRAPRTHRPQAPRTHRPHGSPFAAEDNNWTRVCVLAESGTSVFRERVCSR
eukprot:4140133-Prymnesium_polylepis.1